MNSHHYPHSEPSRYPFDDMKRLISSAHTALEQPPPPSLREILTAYRTKGDGDRDMLLAMLNAKTAEDQRLASVTALHRTILEIYQFSPYSPTSPAEPNPYPRSATNGAYHYPTSNFPQPSRDQTSLRRLHHRHRASSRSRSPPPRIHSHSHFPPARDMPMPHHLEHPRKRHRSSRSPHLSHAAVYESSSHPSEQFPPSPYSSSDRSDSAEYSPRSRASMTIGSLLSSGPNREINGDIQSQQGRD